MPIAPVAAAQARLAGAKKLLAGALSEPARGFDTPARGCLSGWHGGGRDCLAPRCDHGGEVTRQAPRRPHVDNISNITSLDFINTYGICSWYVFSNEI